MGSLSLVCGSHVPRELEGENRDEEVEIGLVDKRQEDYVPPPAPAYTAFSGEGQTMGCVLQRDSCCCCCSLGWGADSDRSWCRSTPYAAEAVVQGSVPTERPVLDDKKPKTTLQIRLHNGSRLRETMNLDHTVRDLHAIIQLYVSIR